MKHHDLVTNPIFKLVGIGAILYFALFYNKHDNRSLSRRYSAQNIKESISEASKKKKEIEQKISRAKKLQEKAKIENYNK